MMRQTVQASDLESGMVIVPKLRTMRHAKVERVGVSGMDASMRNHDQPYVTVRTDIGTRSIRHDELVEVLIEGT